MKRKLLLNTLASGGHTAVVGLVGILILPFQVSRLGVLELGLLGIVNIFAMTGYIGLFELGLQSSIAKYTSQFAANQEYGKVAELFNSILVVFLVIGIALAVTGTLSAGFLASTAFRVPAGYARALAFSLSLTFASYVFLFPGIAVQGLLEGMQRFRILKGVQAGIVIANAIGTVVLLLMGYRFVALVVLLVLTQVLQVAVLFTYASLTVPGMQLTPRLFSLDALRAIRRMTSFLFAGRVSSHLFYNTDRFLVATLLGGVAMGYYDILIKIPRGLKVVLGFVNTAVMPAVSELVARGRHQAVQRLLLLGTKVHMIVSYPIVTALMFFAEPLLATWVGSEYVHLAPLLRWALGYNLIVALIGIGGSIVVGSDRALRTFTAVSFLGAILNVATTLVLLKLYGLAGVFMGTVVASLLTLPLFVHTFLRVATVGHRAFWLQIVSVVGAGLVPLGTAILLRSVIVPTNFVYLATAIVAWCVTYWVSLLLFASGPDEREALRVVKSLFVPRSSASSAPTPRRSI